MSGSCESWGLNSTHIHGTHVPVEEPSTASKAAMSNRSKTAHLFDHLVGAGEKGRRNVEAKRLGGLEIDHKVKLEQCCRALYFSAAPIAPAIQ
jgi:hypothetical protein